MNGRIIYIGDGFHVSRLRKGRVVHIGQGLGITDDWSMKLVSRFVTFSLPGCISTIIVHTLNVRQQGAVNIFERPEVSRILVC